MTPFLHHSSFIFQAPLPKYEDPVLSSQPPSKQISERKLLLPIISEGYASTNFQGGPNDSSKNKKEQDEEVGNGSKEREGDEESGKKNKCQLIALLVRGGGLFIKKVFTRPT